MGSVPFDVTVSLKRELLIAHILQGLGSKSCCLALRLQKRTIVQLENILEAVKAGVIEVDTRGFLRVIGEV